MNIELQLLDKSAKIPTKTHETDAGWDLYALEEAVVGPEVVKIRTGIAVNIPRGYVGLVWDRSGLGSRGLKVHCGVIDAGYTGELIVCLSYPAQEQTGLIKSLLIAKGDRAAQLVIQEIPVVSWKLVDSFETTARGKKGFGSSGK